MATRRPPRPFENEPQATAHALRLLGRRPYSRGELRSRLERRRTPEGIVSAVISKLERMGYVDDAAFAEAFVRSRIARGWGPEKVRSALARSRVPAAIARDALSRGYPGEVEEERARSVLEGRRSRFEPRRGGGDGRSCRDRALRFLVSRGYSPGSARRAVAGLFGYNSESFDD